MNHITSFAFAIVLYCFILAGPCLAFDNYSLLKNGNEARNRGDNSKAATLYQEYIASHPFSKSVDRHTTDLKYSQNYIRNLLKAYDSLFDILRDSNDIEQLEIWRKKLSVTYDSVQWGIKNRYSLARIYLENNWIDDSIGILEGVITDHQTEYWQGNNKAFLRSAEKLRTLYTQQGNTEKLDHLYEEVEKIPLKDLDMKDKLQLARLYRERDA